MPSCIKSFRCLLSLKALANIEIKRSEELKLKIIKKLRLTKFSFMVMTLSTLTISLAHANSLELNQEMKVFKVTTYGTRIIYNPSSAGMSLTVENPQSYPMLVQSKVFKSDKTEKAPFVVTPPLFRLDGYQKNKLRIIAYGNKWPADKESLNWLCITGIPPEADSAWAGDYEVSQKKTPAIVTQLRVKSCMKLIVRPNALKGTPSDVATHLVWKKEGSLLTVNNPTPFYMNFKTVEIGNDIINSPGYAPPFGELNIHAKVGESRVVKWRLINDFGGDSHEFQSNIN